jgi:membrane-bound lytic murein transglycosylase B
MIKAIVWGVIGLVVLALAMGSFVSDGISLQATPGIMSAQYKAMYLAAAGTCPGLPPEVLMAIGQIESGHGANDGPSYAGAIGPMQFMPATWVAYGVDGNHDGFADPFDPADAIPSTARLLCADGAGNPKSLIDAVELYNPGDPTYAVAVMEVAKGYTKEVPGATATVTAPPTSTSH